MGDIVDIHSGPFGNDLQLQSWENGVLAALPEGHPAESALTDIVYEVLNTIAAIREEENPDEADNIAAIKEVVQALDDFVENVNQQNPDALDQLGATLGYLSVSHEKMNDNLRQAMSKVSFLPANGITLQFSGPDGMC